MPIMHNKYRNTRHTIFSVKEPSLTFTRIVIQYSFIEEIHLAAVNTTKHNHLFVLD